MPEATLVREAYVATFHGWVPYASPYPPGRMRWALRVIGWSGHELGRRLDMDEGSVRQMLRTEGTRPCPTPLATWLESLAAIFIALPPPYLIGAEEDVRICPFDRLRDLLREMGWSSAELARRLGESEHVVANWTRPRGHQRAPVAVRLWLETMVAVHEALPLPVGWARKTRG